MKYLFIFGRDPVLSFGELICYLKKEQIQATLLDFNEFGAVFEIELFHPTWVDALGGVVKIARVEFEFTKIETISEHNLRFLDFLPEKFAYGMSVYGGTFYEEFQTLLKDYFRRQKFKSFQIPSVESFGSLETLPSEILKKKLVSQGTDFIVFLGKKQYFGRTVAVSDVREIEKRDLKRPRRNPLQAVSIRLAKILVNLSQVGKREILLDPFCGIGTILQEAFLQGIQGKGLDLNSERVEDAGYNLQALGAVFEILKGDAGETSRFFSRESIDGIATEPYLGPLLKHTLSAQEARKRIVELEGLYRTFFSEAARVLKKGRFLAIVLPYFKTREGDFSLNLQHILPSSLRIFDPLEDLLDRGFPIEYEERKIGRKIYVFQKVV